MKCCNGSTKVCTLSTPKLNSYVRVSNQEHLRRFRRQNILFFRLRSNECFRMVKLFLLFRDIVVRGFRPLTNLCLFYRCCLLPVYGHVVHGWVCCKRLRMKFEPYYKRLFKLCTCTCEVLISWKKGNTMITIVLFLKKKVQNPRFEVIYFIIFLCRWEIASCSIFYMSLMNIEYFCVGFCCRLRCTRLWLISSFFLISSLQKLQFGGLGWSSF